MTKLIDLDEYNNPINASAMSEDLIFPEVEESASTITDEERYLAELNSVLKTDNYWPIDQLPTNFEFYESYAKIYARPLKILELKMLGRMDNKTSDHIINEILRKCIVGINHELLYEVDKLFLVIWLRANTFKSTEYDFSFSCPHCENETKTKVSVNDFNIKFLSADNTVLTPIELPDSKHKINIGFSQIKNESPINKLFNQLIEEQELSKAEYDDIKQLVTYAANILSINDQDFSDNASYLGHKYKYVADLSGSDFMVIESHFNKPENLCGMDSFFNVNCAHCDKGREGLAAPVVFHGSFFTPII